MMQAFVIVALLIAGWSQAQDSHALDLPYPTEVAHDGVHTLDIHPRYKDWLRSPSMEDELPTAILITVKCLSDTDVEMSIPVAHQTILDILTRQGWVVLHYDMVREGGNICRKVLEEKYGYPTVTF